MKFYRCAAAESSASFPARRDGKKANLWERKLASLYGARKSVKETIQTFSAMSEIFDDPAIAFGLGFGSELSLFSADDFKSASQLPFEEKNHIFARRKFRHAGDALSYVSDGSARLFDSD